MGDTSGRECAMKSSWPRQRLIKNFTLNEMELKAKPQTSTNAAVVDPTPRNRNAKQLVLTNIPMDLSNFIIYILYAACQKYIYLLYTCLIL